MQEEGHLTSLRGAGVLPWFAIKRDHGLRNIPDVRFEVFTAVMKNAVIWDVTPFGSRKNRRFGGT
jgi:hypothetical protein